MEADIEEIMRMIWSSLFGRDIEAAGGHRLDDTTTVTSLVHIDGAWRGAVMLRCTPTLADALTSNMFQTSGRAGPDEVRDAMGEIANMVAGNLKALLPGQCSLSLPAVVHGTDYRLEVMGTTRVASVPFVSEGLALEVTVLRRDGGSGVEE